MKKPGRNNVKAGFSLVEVLVVVLMSSVLLIGVYSTFIVGNRAWVHYDDTIAIKKEARRALFSMVKEIREAANIRVIHQPQGVSISFSKPIGGPVTYTWRRDGQDAQKIIRREQWNSRVLGRDISDLDFQYINDAVVIDLDAGRRTSAGNDVRVSLKEKVALRVETAYFQ